MKEDKLTILFEEYMESNTQVKSTIVDCMKHLCGVYEKHIDSLSLCRDELIKNNELLIKENLRKKNKIERLESELDKVRKEYHEHLKNISDKAISSSLVSIKH